MIKTYLSDIESIRKEVGAVIVLTRKKYRAVRKTKPNLPPDKILVKQFGSFKKFIELYENKPKVKEPKPVTKPVKKPEPRLAVGLAENFTESERRFIRVVGAYKEAHNIAFPSIIEFYRLARKFLGLKDEHKDLPNPLPKQEEPDDMSLT